MKSSTSDAKIAILDYGSGNLHSVERAVAAAGAKVVVTSDTHLAADCDGLVVPGVGAFSACMDGLNQLNAGKLIDRRLAGGRPVLGICVGMQVMFDSGVEHGETTRGFGEWPGVVDQLDAPVLPHMGWNTVDTSDDSQMFAGIHNERFYFVHSYGVREWKLPPSQHLVAPRVTWTEHGGRFVSAVENGPLWATQFHPEKSGRPGVALLRNWLATVYPSAHE